MIDFILISCKRFPISLVQPCRVGADPEPCVSVCEGIAHLCVPTLCYAVEVQFIAVHVPLSSPANLNITLLHVPMEARYGGGHRIARGRHIERFGYYPHTEFAVLQPRLKERR